MITSKNITASVFASLVLLHGCATQPPTYEVKASSIAAGDGVALPDNSVEAEQTQLPKPRVESVQSMGLGAQRLARPADLSEQFSATEKVMFAADKLPLKDFVHNLFSDLLNRSYVLASEVTEITDPVTLNIKEPISQREAFRLAFDLLQKKGVSLAEKDGIFYLAPTGSQAQSTMGVGANPADVPNVAGTVTQVVPLIYSNASIESSIANFVPVRVSRDQQLNTLFITGVYSDVVKALDVVKLLDRPANRGRHIRLIRLTYLSPEEFSKKAQTLLESEGIENVGVGSAIGKSLVFVPVDNLGAVVVFSATESYIERVAYWAQQIDVAGEGIQKRYFIYHPSYARATDLGASIAALLGQGSQVDTSRDTQSAMNTADSSSASSSASSTSSRRGGRSQRTAAGPSSVQNENMSMTVDERSNTIVFYTTGAEYQTILPMVKRLDVMPKQVLLEATIAEVTLTDEFAMGLEFALRNGKLNMGTTGAFGVAGISGLNLGFVDGTDQILARIKQTSQLVNVLSNPSVVVRDGIEANISVGNEIPTVSSTTSDPLLSDKLTNTITYRQTGLEFNVRPTINGQGLVVMEISQNISNQSTGSVVDGAPAIFKRSLETEVIAQSGQTVLLGGLISENDDSGNSKVPVLGDIPLIGNLFKGKTQKKVKTELVLLITPRVIDASEQWLYINGQLQQGFKHLQIKN